MELEKIGINFINLIVTSIYSSLFILNQFMYNHFHSNKFKIQFAIKFNSLLQ
jgi:hypothetical protein